MPSVAVLERRETIDIKEWFVRIGIVALFAAFFVSILVINFKYLEPPKPDPNTNLTLRKVVEKARKENVPADVIKRAIDLLNKNNVKINALAVLNKRNYQYVDKIIDFFVENNIYDFSFNYFIKGGRGNKNSHLSLTNEEVFEATKMVVDKIEEYFKKGIILNEKNVYYLYKMVKTGRKHYMCANSPCGAGLNIFGITPAGDIFPCDDLSSEEQFCLGNINEKKLDEILESPITLSINP